MEKYKKIYDDYFTDDLPKNARYIFLPHAGYQYSGFASWCALAKVSWTNIERVILLHRPKRKMRQTFYKK